MLGTVAVTSARVPVLGSEEGSRVAQARQWYASNAMLVAAALLFFVVEVVANVTMRGAVRYLVIGLCAGAMLACLWRLSVNNRSGNSGSG